MKKHIISQHHYDHLSKKLEYLKNVKRKDLNEAWRLAVAEGDDRETDAITVSFNLIRSNEQEIVDLENTLFNSQIIKEGSGDRVDIGRRVRLRLNDLERLFTMTDPIEADPAVGLLSIDTPIGQAISGKPAGYKTSTTLPDGKKIQIEILSVD